MQSSFTQEMEKPCLTATPSGSEKKRLAGKVVLMIGSLEKDDDDSGDGNGRTLASDLAAQGADIVLLHDAEAIAQAKETQQLVQANGQRCLLIPLSPQLTPYDIVRQILEKLGRLDVFLDFTRDNDAHPHGASPWSATRLPLFVAAMKQMVTQTGA